MDEQHEQEHRLHLHEGINGGKADDNVLSHDKKASTTTTTAITSNGIQDAKQEHDQNDGQDAVDLRKNGESAAIIQTRTTPSRTPTWAYILLSAFAAITYMAMPSPLHPENGEPTIQHVFFYGWLTCLSTGLGAVPFFFLPEVPAFWVGIANAVAAGMMMAASYTLIVEGATYNDPHDTSTVAPEVRTALGTLLGLVFILGTKRFLDQHENISVAGLGGADARKALLVFFVMTLHSFSEGVGVGVSFGGMHGNELGMFISASLAVHNVPEGMAIAVVLLPRGLSVLAACIWATCTSLPQPIMAVPAFMFVHTAIPYLPVGLGFAGGAMLWVAFFELLVEAIEETSIWTACLVSTPALLLMLAVQSLLEDASVLQMK